MRRAAAVLGIAVLIIAWAFAQAPTFSQHMTVHITVVAVAAPLLAFGLADTRLDLVRYMPAIFAPILASLIELAVVWLWHTPALHHAARADFKYLVAEQASFIVSGLYLWISALGGRAEVRSDRAAAGVVALLLTAMHMTLLGALIALSPRPLYDHYHAATSLTPLEDQHLGGAIMLLVGGLSYIAGGLWLAASLLYSRLSRNASRSWRSPVAS